MILDILREIVTPCLDSSQEIPGNVWKLLGDNLAAYCVSLKGSYMPKMYQLCSIGNDALKLLSKSLNVCFSVQMQWMNLSELPNDQKYDAWIKWSHVNLQVFMFDMIFMVFPNNIR